MQITDKMIKAATKELIAHGEFGTGAERNRLNAEIAARAALEAALSAADAEPVKWPNRCNESAVEALRYLSVNDRPIGGEEIFNRAHLLQIADEIERMASRPLYAAPPAVVSQDDPDLTAAYMAGFERGKDAGRRDTEEENEQLRKENEIIRGHLDAAIEDYNNALKGGSE